MFYPCIEYRVDYRLFGGKKLNLGLTSNKFME
jgi:hypothetical protein